MNRSSLGQANERKTERVGPKKSFNYYVYRRSHEPTEHTKKDSKSVAHWIADIIFRACKSFTFYTISHVASLVRFFVALSLRVLCLFFRFFFFALSFLARLRLLVRNKFTQTLTHVFRINRICNWNCDLHLKTYGCCFLCVCFLLILGPFSAWSWIFFTLSLVRFVWTFVYLNRCL